jgi:hypothetical protein
MIDYVAPDVADPEAAERSDWKVRKPLCRSVALERGELAGSSALGRFDFGLSCRGPARGLAVQAGKNIEAVCRKPR